MAISNTSISDYLFDVFLMEQQSSSVGVFNMSGDNGFRNKNNNMERSEDRALTTWCNWLLHSKGLEINHLGQLKDGTFLITILEELTGLKSYDDAYRLRSPTTSLGLRQRNWATILDVLGLDASSLDGKNFCIFLGILNSKKS